MTYQDLISNLSEEIREKRAWPENASGDKLAEQLRIAYTVAVTIGQTMPRQVLGDSMKEEDLDGTEADDYYTSALPDDIFFVRADMGIELLSFGDHELYEVHEGVRRQSFGALSRDPHQYGNVFFHLDNAQQKLYFHGTNSCTITYIPLFEEPDSSSADTEFPLPEPYSEQAKQLMAQHVNAILNGRSGMSAVNNSFAQLYGSGIEQFMVIPDEVEAEA